MGGKRLIVSLLQVILALVALLASVALGDCVPAKTARSPMLARNDVQDLHRARGQRGILGTADADFVGDQRIESGAFRADAHCGRQVAGESD